MSSRYYSASLSQSDRIQVLTALGMEKFELQFLEVCGDTILRRSFFQGPESQSCLLPATLTEWKASCSEEEALIHTHPAAGQLSLATSHATQSLWSQVFPFPFGLAAQFTKLQPLAESFRRLESKLATSELTCMYIEGEKVTLPLLAHTVRGKVIRVGKSDLLQPLREAQLAGRLSAESLFKTFGTRTSFLHWNTHVATGWTISGVAKSLLASIESALWAPPISALSNDFDDIGL